jgi:hypothetical protein
MNASTTTVTLCNELIEAGFRFDQGPEGHRRAAGLLRWDTIPAFAEAADHHLPLNLRAKRLKPESCANDQLRHDLQSNGIRARFSVIRSETLEPFVHSR